jgi:hypothetical protein
LASDQHAGQCRQEFALCNSNFSERITVVQGPERKSPIFLTENRNISFFVGKYIILADKRADCFFMWAKRRSTLGAMRADGIEPLAIEKSDSLLRDETNMFGKTATKFSFGVRHPA